MTRMIEAIHDGDPHASDELLPLVYDELRKLASMRLSHEPPGQTLQATALVHEAYLRLLGSGVSDEKWENRGHFFAAAAEAMRRIMIENARRKKRLKRGGEFRRVPLELVDVAITADPDNLLLVNEALSKLEAEDPAKAKLVKLRFFAGLKNTEAAAAMGISPTTAKRYWAFARAWLYHEISSMD